MDIQSSRDFWQTLVSPDFMLLSMADGDFILDVDTSNYGVSAVMS